MIPTVFEFWEIFAVARRKCTDHTGAVKTGKENEIILNRQ